MQKAELQPATERSPDHVALDETVIKLNTERYWLYATVDPETNEFLHVRLFMTRNEGVTSIFLSELAEEHDVENAVFPVDSAPWLQAALHRHRLRFQYERHGNRNVVKRLLQEIKRRTSQFGNYFRNTDPATAETWLQNYAYFYEDVLNHVERFRYVLLSERPPRVSRSG